jgi:hypothetical protein
MWMDVSKAVQTHVCGFLSCFLICMNAGWVP